MGERVDTDEMDEERDERDEKSEIMEPGVSGGEDERGWHSFGGA